MLILNIKKNEVNKKYRFFNKKSNIKRESIYIGNNLYYVITLSENDLKNDEFIRLAKVNKGKILPTSDNSVNEYLSDYLFSNVDYLKRSIISNLIKSTNSIGNNIKYVIEDSNFKLFDEYYLLAQKVRYLGFVCENNTDFQRFCDKCYIDYGIVITSETKNDFYNCFYLKLENINSDGKTVFYYKSNSGIIYPDSAYYTCNEEIQQLINFDVPLNTACSIIYS